METIAVAWEETSPGVQARRVGDVVVRVFLWEDGKFAFTARCDERNQDKYFAFERGFDSEEDAKAKGILRAGSEYPEAAPSTPMKPLAHSKGTYFCSRCLAVGHNRRTCAKARR